MSAAIRESSSLWETSLLSEAQDNLWRGPAASSSTLAVKPAASSIRKIKRKPAPIVPVELLQDQPCSSSITPLELPRPALAAKSLNTVAFADTTPTQESASSSVSPPAPSSQKPRRQYFLDIDTPSSSQDSSNVANDSVRQLLRSATVSPSSASVRARKGPLKWMQDKEEHTASSSSATLSPRQPTLSRKTSISAHLKMSLRRQKADEPASELTISGPTNFVHLATGEGLPTSEALKRSATTSARSSTFSALSAGSGDAVEDSEDKPLYTAVGQPLRPLKSIRRPSKLALDKAQGVAAVPSGSTSPKDKRKGIYAAPGLVPVILEPVRVSDRSSASKLSPIVSPASPGRDHFTASLGRTIGGARDRDLDGGESPEPELSRSPSSGYESSTCTSNRSSLGSLQEFKTFLDFPDLPLAESGKADRGVEVDVWANALAMPLPVRRV